MLSLQHSYFHWRESSKVSSLAVCRAICRSPGFTCMHLPILLAQSFPFGVAPLRHTNYWCLIHTYPVPLLSCHNSYVCHFGAEVFPVCSLILFPCLSSSTFFFAIFMSHLTQTSVCLIIQWTQGSGRAWDSTNLIHHLQSLISKPGMVHDIPTVRKLKNWSAKICRTILFQISTPNIDGATELISETGEFSDDRSVNWVIFIQGQYQQLSLSVGSPDHLSSIC